MTQMFGVPSQTKGRNRQMGNKNYLLVINYPKEHPWKTTIIGLLVAVAGLVLAVKGCQYTKLNYIEKHTAKLAIAAAYWSYGAIIGTKDGNVSGIQIVLENQGSSWAKNVKIEFINEDGYSVYEKLNYLRKNNRPVEPISIAPSPTGKILVGWMPQGPSASPKIYESNEVKYKSYVFINWENDLGQAYSLVAGFESIADNFNKFISFPKIYEYDTFKNKDKVDEIKKKYKKYLPEDMLSLIKLDKKGK